MAPPLGPEAGSDSLESLCPNRRPSVKEVDTRRRENTAGTLASRQTAGFALWTKESSRRVIAPSSVGICSSGARMYKGQVLTCIAGTVALERLSTRNSARPAASLVKGPSRVRSPRRPESLFALRLTTRFEEPGERPKPQGRPWRAALRPSNGAPAASRTAWRKGRRRCAFGAPRPRAADGAAGRILVSIPEHSVTELIAQLPCLPDGTGLGAPPAKAAAVHAVSSRRLVALASTHRTMSESTRAWWGSCKRS
jgi:hypothetical protein